MEFRKLKQEEHGWTRALYEEAFPEDGRAFTDYYYQWKTRDNVIFAALEEEKICGMVHLNPVTMWMDEKLQELHYIVAVATRKEYRHQGIMRRLLNLAEKYMKEREEAFTFLMPASEAIYKPFGYRFFCCQRQGVIRGRKSERAVCRCRLVREDEYQELSLFVNGLLRENGMVFVWRDREYYMRMAREQQCQGGNVWGVYAGERLLGTFCTERPGEDAGIQIRELLCPREEVREVREALENFVSDQGKCRVRGCPLYFPLEEERQKPLYMGKRPGSGDAKQAFRQEEWFVNEVV